MRGADIDPAAVRISPIVNEIRDFLDRSKLGDLWSSKDLRLDLNRPSLFNHLSHPALADYRERNPRNSAHWMWGSRRTIAEFRKQFSKK